MFLCESLPLKNNPDTVKWRIVHMGFGRFSFPEKKWLKYLEEEIFKQERRRSVCSLCLYWKLFVYCLKSIHNNGFSLIDKSHSSTTVVASWLWYAVQESEVTWGFLLLLAWQHTSGSPILAMHVLFTIFTDTYLVRFILGVCANY